jgi:hypothetical protein
MKNKKSPTKHCARVVLRGIVVPVVDDGVDKTMRLMMMMMMILMILLHDGVDVVDVV